MTVSSNNSGTGVLDRFAERGVFYAFAIVFLWFGLMKFTAYEADAIGGLVSNSPFLAFLPKMLGSLGTAKLIGTVELIIAVLLALRFHKPNLAVFGAIGATITFLITFSLFFTTPGVFIPEHGFYAISVVPGQFLLKDLALLAASIWMIKNAKAAAR